MTDLSNDQIKILHFRSNLVDSDRPCHGESPVLSLVDASDTSQFKNQLFHAAVSLERCIVSLEAFLPAIAVVRSRRSLRLTRCPSSPSSPAGGNCRPAPLVGALLQQPLARRTSCAIFCRRLASDANLGSPFPDILNNLTRERNTHSWGCATARSTDLFR
jgi:hypothetical protein